jgi:uncharacterized protein DUF397
MTSDSTRWRKSSYSGGQGGNCVEVAGQSVGGRVLVRDTKDRTGTTLRFAPEVWRRFADQAKSARSLAAALRSAGLRPELHRRISSRSVESFTAGMLASSSAATAVCSS